MAGNLIDSDINVRCEWQEINKLNGQICDAIKKLDVSQWERLSFGIKRGAQGLNIRVKGHASDYKRPQCTETTQSRNQREAIDEKLRAARESYSIERKQFIELIDEGTQTTDVTEMVAFFDIGSVAWGPVKKRRGWCFRKVQLGFTRLTPA